MYERYIFSSSFKCLEIRKSIIGKINDNQSWYGAIFSFSVFVANIHFPGIYREIDATTSTIFVVTRDRRTIYNLWNSDFAKRKLTKTSNLPVNWMAQIFSEISASFRRALPKSENGAQIEWNLQLVRTLEGEKSFQWKQKSLPPTLILKKFVERFGYVSKPSIDTKCKNFFKVQSWRRFDLFWKKLWWMNV